jgi:hypothetical protein
MKPISIAPALTSQFAIAVALSLPLSLSLSGTVLSQEGEPCQAYTVEAPNTGYGYEEVNTCPLVRGDFSIRGTFANENWRVSISQWEPAAYIYKGVNRRDGSEIQLMDFDVVGTTSRPQYRFTNEDVTYVVTFRYSDPDTIRVEIYQGDRVILNELLDRESDEVMR